MHGQASVACQEFLFKSLPVQMQEPRGKQSLHVAGKSSKRLLGYYPIIKPRSMTALAYIQPLREEVVWYPARRFLCDAAALSRTCVIPHDILQGILEPAGHSNNFSPNYSLNIFIENLAHSLLGMK